MRLYLSAYAAWQRCLVELDAAANPAASRSNGTAGHTRVRAGDLFPNFGTLQGLRFGGQASSGSESAAVHEDEHRSRVPEDKHGATDSFESFRFQREDMQLQGSSGSPSYRSTLLVLSRHFG